MSVLTEITTGLLRYTTDWFINQTATIAGPVDIILQREVKVDKPGGGHDFTRAALPVQTFRLINQTITDGISTSPNDDGVARRDGYILIGQWNADIKYNDIFELQGGHYKVDGLIPNNGYESRASATAFDAEPDYGS